jgi:hypothetical protein
VLSHPFGEKLVHLDVRLPIAYMEWNLIHQVVKQGPQNAVGESFVIAGDLIVGEGNSDQAHAGELLVQLGLLLGRQVLRSARPADPEAPRLLVGPEQAGREATWTLLYLHHTAFGYPDSDRQSVGDNEDPGHGFKV